MQVCSTDLFYIGFVELVVKRLVDVFQFLVDVVRRRQRQALQHHRLFPLEELRVLEVAVRDKLETVDSLRVAESTEPDTEAASLLGTVVILRLKMDECAVYHKQKWQVYLPITWRLESADWCNNGEMD